MDYLTEDKLCDDVQDCRDGSDEDNCDLCEDDEYRCVLSHKVGLLSITSGVLLYFLYPFSASKNLRCVTPNMIVNMKKMKGSAPP